MASKSTFDSPVLVLGATGLVGQFLVHRLLERQVQIIAVSRDFQPPSEGITWLQGDVESLDVTVGVRPRVAFSLVDLWLLPPGLPAILKMGVIRMIAFSSTSRFTKENSIVPAERKMAMRFAAAEAETQSFCARYGIGLTILRPTIIYAEGRDRSVTRIAAIIKRLGWLPLSGRGQGKRQPVHADDLAAGAIASAESSLTVGQAYDLPGGETLSYRAMCERIFDGLQRRPRIISLPPWLWKLAFRVAGRFIPGTTIAMGSRMSDDLIFNGSRAATDFGWHARDFHPQFTAY